MVSQAFSLLQGSSLARTRKLTFEGLASAKIIVFVMIRNGHFAHEGLVVHILNFK